MEPKDPRLKEEVYSTEDEDDKEEYEDEEDEGLITDSDVDAAEEGNLSAKASKLNNNLTPERQYAIDLFFHRRFLRRTTNAAGPRHGKSAFRGKVSFYSC